MDKKMYVYEASEENGYESYCVGEFDDAKSAKKYAEDNYGDDDEPIELIEDNDYAVTEDESGYTLVIAVGTKEYCLSVIGAFEAQFLEDMEG